ncbi:DNA-3-methyladenine glycosylase I [Branchiibius sp. NY16-3462-2]|uniref:DNA-3-methyladenine glycosylase I n=1 Tax=Branchiibius sp. NY16-3462-2 TaxID=1807500 RepID=UPI0007913243|nr:DNA-3-methyladenine glycosylase I [Branchiibius sp. NY16-3462-2]KYH45977.1 3-methyladenine DNA glycosylase [Branchiibius sp. NY16-3462-2]
MGNAVRGEDGRQRCPWGAGPEYLAYHDQEWGRPVRQEAALLERITLEAFQSGLSWLTILRKRPAFRAAFADFDPDAVAAFTDEDRDRLMADAGIVRNRRKVDAAIANARATVALREDGGLVELFWSFQPAQLRRPRSIAEVPASTPESVALAKALRKNGFEHIGPTTMYAAMQACGVVTDHLVDCDFGGAA